MRARGSASIDGQGAHPGRLKGGEIIHYGIMVIPAPTLTLPTGQMCVA